MQKNAMPVADIQPVPDIHHERRVHWHCMGRRLPNVTSSQGKHAACRSRSIANTNFQWLEVNLFGSVQRDDLTLTEVDNALAHVAKKH